MGNIPVFSGGISYDTNATANSLVQRDSGGGITIATISASAITTTGNLSLQTTAKSANYTASTTETVIICDATSAGFTITLPAAASVPGRVYVVKKKDAVAHNVLVTDGTSAVDGGTVTLSTQYQTTRVISDGSTYWTI